MNVMFREDEHFVYVRKPHGLASSLGVKHSICALFPEQEFFSRCMLGENEEYGLVNRLDLPTAGLLYVAKTAQAKAHYLLLQQQEKLSKRYLAKVYGHVPGLFFMCDVPLFHHRFDESKMVVSYESTPSTRGEKQPCTTYATIVSHNYHNDVPFTLLDISLARGKRHQIRAHCARMGYPIVGDWLYCSKKQRQRYRLDASYEKISLRSVGVCVC